MLDELSREAFLPHLEEPFTVALEGLPADFAFRLAEARPLGSETVPGAKRKPFALLFKGPTQPLLPQRIYPLEHPALGRLELFLVPLGPETGEMRYEAVFT